MNETELEILGLDEQLPTVEFEGLDGAEEDLEDDPSASHAASATRATPLATLGR